MKPREVGRVLEKVLVGVVVVLFVGLVVSALAQVVSRYVFNAPFMWTEEAARYLGIWCTLLSAGLLMGRNLHLSIDFVVERLPAAPQMALRVLVYLVTIGFAAVITVYGFSLISKVTTALSPALRIRMSYIYLAVPVGSLLLLLYAVLGLAGVGRKPAPGDAHSGTGDKKEA